MKQDEKSDKKQTLECYLMMFIILVAFFGTFILAGQMSGMNWISYLNDLAKELHSIVFITFI